VEAVPLTWARALLATGQAGAPGRLREAVAYLEAICRRAAETHHTRREIAALALSALALSAQGLPTAALDALERALDLGEPGGFARAFLDLGPPLPALLQEAARRRPLSANAARLLAAAGDSGPPAARSAGAPSPAGRAAPARPGAGPARLSQREGEVLLCLARRLSNKEIARELGISVITVKRHAGSIYGKLGAGTRREAVHRAVAAGLLPAG
jgi:LuxR family maltose regulon positive regulatory protein